MNRYVLMVSALLLLFAFPSFGYDSTRTTTLMDDFNLTRNSRFDDGTCASTANNLKFRNLPCHNGYRYRRSFLYAQFAAGYCRPRLNGKRWVRCSPVVIRSLQRKAGIAVQRPSTEPMKGTYQLSRPTGALPYAADLTACAGYGRRNAGGANMCAKGVRHALACMMRRQGRNVNNMHFHCGSSAYHYYGCLEEKGFINDMTACNKPGVVRVYKGRTQWRSGSGGDYHGHIEFYGTDGMWHAGASSALPINQRLGNSARQLKACYVMSSQRGVQ